MSPIESGARDVVMALRIQGIGFACLFVPLTTVALSNMPRHWLSNATGLNSLLRQIGGAVVLAVFVTPLDDLAAARVSVSSHVSAADLLTMQPLAATTQGFQRSGLDLAPSQTAALAALSSSFCCARSTRHPRSTRRAASIAGRRSSRQAGRFEPAASPSSAPDRRGRGRAGRARRERLRCGLATAGQETTDDAFVDADIVSVQAEVGSRVLECSPTHQKVAAGDRLVRLDARGLSTQQPSSEVS